MASYCDIIGVRSFAHFENREDDYTEKILNQFIKYSGKLYSPWKPLPAIRCRLSRPDYHRGV